jgi:hypothetical protein
MVKTLLSKFGSQAAHVIVAGIIVHAAGLTTIVADHIPTTILTVLSASGITVNTTLLATALVTGLTNALAHYISGGK